MPSYLFKWECSNAEISICYDLPSHGVREKIRHWKEMLCLKLFLCREQHRHGVQARGAPSQKNGWWDKKLTGQKMPITFSTMPVEVLNNRHYLGISGLQIMPILLQKQHCTHHASQQFLFSLTWGMEHFLIFIHWYSEHNFQISVLGDRLL